MKAKQIFLLLFIALIIISTKIYPQRHPDCSDLEVTHIEFTNNNHDTLLVTIYNSCDSCVQHAYTGIIAYRKSDTLALTSPCLTCRLSPLNNDEQDYYVTTKTNFEISEIDKIEMVYVCDSIPFSSTLNIDKNNIRRLSTFKLHQNYPNPFNPETIIEFDIAYLSDVKLLIYNLNGQIIKRLINDQLAPGKYSKSWNGRNQFGEKVSSGLYIYQIIADNFIESRKLILLR